MFDEPLSQVVGQLMSDRVVLIESTRENAIPVVSIVVPFFALTKYIIRIL